MCRYAFAPENEAIRKQRSVSSQRRKTALRAIGGSLLHGTNLTGGAGVLNINPPRLDDKRTLEDLRMNGADVLTYNTEEYKLNR